MLYETLAGTYKSNETKTNGEATKPARVDDNLIYWYSFSFNKKTNQSAEK
jgi:hypothetical protein